MSSEDFVDAVMAEDEAAKGIDDLAVPAEEATAAEGAATTNGGAGRKAKKAPKPPAEPLEEPDLTLIGVKISKDFDKVPYIGEIKSARKTKEGPLYKVLYRDGDDEEFFAKEVMDGKAAYDTLSNEMWDCITTLVEDLDVAVLAGAGINSVSDLELFGAGSATKLPETGNPFDALDMPLVVKQKLYIIATYLLNDQIVTADSKIEEMARYNVAKATGNIRKPRQKRTVAANPKGRPGRKPKTTAVKATATTKKTRGLPKKAAKTVVKKARTTVAKAKADRPKTVRSSPTKKRAAGKATSAEVDYTGPPKDELQGVSDWPGSASEGWTFTIKKRSGSDHVDRYWTSPGGTLLRSKVEVRKFLVALDTTDGDEAEAKKSYKDVSL